MHTLPPFSSSDDRAHALDGPRLEQHRVEALRPPARCAPVRLVPAIDDLVGDQEAA